MGPEMGTGPGMGAGPEMAAGPGMGAGAGMGYVLATAMTLGMELFQTWNLKWLW